jgi:hypothetical protein
MRYYIYVFSQIGNVGAKEIEPINDQPEEGFKTEPEAETHLLDLIEKGKAHYFSWYKFTILKTYSQKERSK